MNRNSWFESGRLLGLAVAGVALLGSSGCATINYDAAAVQSVVAMNRVAPAASYTRVGDFEASQRPVFAIAQLLTVVDANLERAIQRELQRSGGDAVLDLRIHEQYDIVDVLIGMVTFGLVNTRSAAVRGDVVRWNTGFLENGGEEWLGQACRELEVDGGDGTRRAAYVCIAPEPEQELRLGLN